MSLSALFVPLGVALADFRASLKCQSVVTLLGMWRMTQGIEAEPLAVRSARPHAVVIGSGFGGLAAAIRLGARGYRVTVLERLDAPGGRAYVFRQDGFTFDAGPTIVTAPFLFEELWTLCGRRMADDIELRQISPFYRIVFDDGSVFHTSADRDAMRAEVARFSPADVAGYDRFMAMSEAIFRVGFERLGHVAFDSFADMARIVPDMIRLSSFRTVYGLVSRYIRDPRLRIVFSFHPLLIGGNPFSASSIYCLIAFLEKQWGVSFVMGGTGRLVQALVGLIEGQGGKVRCNAEVAEIEVRDRTAVGVRLASGERIAADIVVSNADSAFTYRNLVPAHARRRWTDRRLDRARYSMSLFVWYFGTRRRYEDVAHHTILLGPALPRIAPRHLRAQGVGEAISAFICIGRPRRIHRWRHPAATPSTCSRRFRISRAAPTGRPWPSPIGAPSRGASTRRCCRVSSARS